MSYSLLESVLLLLFLAKADTAITNPEGMVMSNTEGVLSSNPEGIETINPEGMIISNPEEFIASDPEALVPNILDETMLSDAEGTILNNTATEGTLLSNPEGMAAPPFQRIRKCCEVGRVLDEMYTCVDGGEKSMEKFMADVSNLTRQDIPEEIIVDVLTITEMTCSGGLVSELSPVKLFKNGTLQVIYDVETGETLSLDRYHCLEGFIKDLSSYELINKHNSDGYTTHDLFAFTCDDISIDEDNSTINHITKCCPGNSVISNDYNDCIENIDDEYKIQKLLPRLVYSHKTYRPTNHYRVQESSFPSLCPCKGVQVEVPNLFLVNGLVVFNYTQEDYKIGEYQCMDRLEGNNSELVVLFCDMQETPRVFEILSCKNTWIESIYLVLGIISSVCIAITILMYVIVPGMSNLHSHIVLANSVSMLGTTILFIINNGIQPSEPNSCLHNLDYCTPLGFLLYFFSLSMFSWMTTFSIHISWTIYTIQVPRQGGYQTRFLTYSLLSWGIPLSMTGCAIYGQFYYPPDHPYNPNIGHTNCFIPASRQLIFLQIPIIAMLGFTILAYIFVIRNTLRAAQNNKGEVKRYLVRNSESSFQ